MQLFVNPEAQRRLIEANADASERLDAQLFAKYVGSLAAESTELTPPDISAHHDEDRRT